MICHDIITHIPRFLEETLSEHESLLFSQHLQTCERCRILCLNARRAEQAKGRWIRITAVLNILLIFIAAVYFVFAPVINAKIKDFLQTLKGKKAFSTASGQSSGGNPGTHKIQPYVQLKPLHWDMYFPHRSKLDTLASHLRTNGIKVLYEDSGSVILKINRDSVSFLASVLADAGGTFQGGGSVYSFRLPEFDGEFRISINLKFPQSRVSQPLAHHWHLNFQLPNRFMAKDSIQEAGARFVFEVPEIWVIQIPGRDLSHLKEVLRGTHGVEIDFGTESVSAESYGKIPVTVSLYISEG